MTIENHVRARAAHESALPERVRGDAVQSLEQLKSVWSVCVKDRGAGEVSEREGLAIRWADNGYAFWNTLANDEIGATDAQTKAMLNKAADYMRSQTQAGFLWIFDDILSPEARRALPIDAERAGLKLSLTGFCMAADILPLFDEPQHDELEFVRVRSDAEAIALGMVNCKAYGFPSTCADAGFGKSQVWRNEIHAWLGLKNGVPVTAGGAIEADGCLFVLMIATLPGHNGRGYGTAITRKVLYEGARTADVRRATLHATEAGARIYERIGFRKVGSIGFYSLVS